MCEEAVWKVRLCEAAAAPALFTVLCSHQAHSHLSHYWRIGIQ